MHPVEQQPRQPVVERDEPFISYDYRPSNYKRRPCFNFQRGLCTRGAYCRFSHDVEWYAAPRTF